MGGVRHVNVQLQLPASASSLDGRRFATTFLHYCQGRLRGSHGAGLDKRPGEAKINTLHMIQDTTKIKQEMANRHIPLNLTQGQTGTRGTKIKSEHEHQNKLRDTKQRYKKQNYNSVSLYYNTSEEVD